MKETTILMNFHPKINFILARVWCRWSRFNGVSYRLGTKAQFYILHSAG
jgi:hypothetical protein